MSYLITLNERLKLIFYQFFVTHDKKQIVCMKSNYAVKQFIFYTHYPIHT